jgi:protein arginine N-methyltransferase 1
VYELDDYLRMVTDTVRTPAYLAAMAQVIRPGDRVLELGTGFGYFAAHACRLGAAHVWAVEPNDAVGFGRAVAEANGCADRITFLQAVSQSITLPERADVLVEDLRGISPLHESRLVALRDAERRLLVPGARRVPLADDLRLAPSELPERLHRLGPDAPHEVHGISVEPLQRLLHQTIHRASGAGEGLLAAGATWHRLDYANLGDDDPQGRAEFVVERAGAFAGFASWFAASLAPGIGFETSPLMSRTVYDHAFLPIGDPIAVEAGDVIVADVRTKFDGTDHVWAWEAEVRHGNDVVVTRRCSNLATRVMSAERRGRRAAVHRPARTPDVAHLATLLDAVDGRATLEEIAARLAARHPERFATEQDALRWAGERLARLAEEPAP